MKNPDYIRYCPGCNKEIEPSTVLMFDFVKMGITFARFEAPYFLCGDCRLAAIEQTVIKKSVSFWRNVHLTEQWQKKKLARNKMCEMVTENLENLFKNHFIPNLGYKKIKSFNKTPRK